MLAVLPVALILLRQTPAAVSLEIPAVSQDPIRPNEGWCGEAAIQMIGLYYGLYAPQKLINLLGHPTHPDLWSNELESASLAIGLQTTPYRSSRADLTDFERWMKGNLSRGVPVLLGVGIYTHHQGAYHFVTVQSYDDRGLCLNDTWGFRTASYSWAKMRERAEGIGYPNDESGYMGFAMQPPAHLSGRAVRLAPVDSTSFFSEPSISLKATLRGLEPGRSYEILRYGSMSQAVGDAGSSVVATMTATKEEGSMTISVPKKSVSVIRYRPVGPKAL